MRKALAFLIILGATAILPSFAHAQNLGAEPLTISVSPEFPEPYQTVTVTPRSTLLNLAASAVTVSVNGKVVSTGSGGASTSFQMGGPGQTAVVTVSATGPDGSYQASVTLRPSNISLIVEPMSVTHPLYEGGSLLAAEGRVRLIALADMRSSAGTPIAAANLVYNWQLGNQQLAAQSGIGRSVLTATGPLLYRDATVTVTVSTPDGSASGQSRTVLEPVEQQVLVYRNNPLLGPDFSKTITGETSLSEGEDSFRAVPYFFPTMPNFSWSVNGAPSGSEQVITVRSNGDGAGSALLSVEASQPGTYLAASNSFTVRFGEDTGLFDFFGL